jgi:hypothetical protein
MSAEGARQAVKTYFALSGLVLYAIRTQDFGRSVAFTPGVVAARS